MPWPASWPAGRSQLSPHQSNISKLAYRSNTRPTNLNDYIVVRSTALKGLSVNYLSPSAPGITLLMTILVSRPWRPRSLPRSLRYPPFSFLFLLLVGFLRRFHAPTYTTHPTLHPRHQFLGRWSLSSSLLDNLLSIRRHQAAVHDGSAGWRPRRWRETILPMEGCCGRGMEEGWMERVLEGICAMLFEGLPGECNGAGGI